jgi:hypothetical protein
VDGDIDAAVELLVDKTDEFVQLFDRWGLEVLHRQVELREEGAVLERERQRILSQGDDRPDIVGYEIPEVVLQGPNQARQGHGVERPLAPSGPLAEGFGTAHL